MTEKKEEKRRKPKEREEKRQHVMLGSGQESQSTLQHRAYHPRISNPGMIGAFSEKLNDSQDLEISVFVRPK